MLKLHFLASNGWSINFEFDIQYMSQDGLADSEIS